jgi:hypothetical protein
MQNQSATTLALLALTGALVGGVALAPHTAPTAPAPLAAVAPASPIQIARPFPRAVVRESVPIRLRDFPRGGYVAVFIDGRFVTAQALPRSRAQAVYVWDTKAGYADPDDPNTTREFRDGAHVVTVTVYGRQSEVIGSDSVRVQLANKIALPAGQGIRLSYPWRVNLALRYQRRTDLTASSTGDVAGTPGQSVQQSLLRYRRTVENATGGQYLIRDALVPVDRAGARSRPFVSYVSTRSQVQPLDGFRALYRVVDSQGRVLSTLQSQNSAASLGFSLPVLPARRVSVGAHWQSPVQATLDWTSPYPARLRATGTLEGFEWQDRYPTAKIRETYTGPAFFRPAPGSALPPASQSLSPRTLRRRRRRSGPGTA